LFVCETRTGEKKIKDLRWRLGLRKYLTQLGKGKGAGIALYWDEQLEIKVLSQGPRYFDVLINDRTNGRKWRGTFVYGEPKSSERHHIWNILHRIKTDADVPWMMIGDFNETKWQHEHFSETKRSESRMADFRRMLNYCDLHDIPFAGPPWTYNNKQKENRNVRSRIDRAVASQSWSALFPGAKLSHVCSSRSDHFPLILECEKYPGQQSTSTPQRYEHVGTSRIGVR
jgi:hypothetical protein